MGDLAFHLKVGMIGVDLPESFDVVSYPFDHEPNVRQSWIAYCAGSSWETKDVHTITIDVSQLRHSCSRQLLSHT
jgi:hypothetical protein